MKKIPLGHRPTVIQRIIATGLYFVVVVKTAIGSSRAVSNMLADRYSFAKM